MEISIPDTAYFILREYENGDDGFGSSYEEKRLCFVCAVQAAISLKLVDQIFTKLHSNENYELFQCEKCGRNIV